MNSFLAWKKLNELPLCAKKNLFWLALRKFCANPFNRVFSCKRTLHKEISVGRDRIKQSEQWETRKQTNTFVFWGSEIPTYQLIRDTNEPDLAKIEYILSYSWIADNRLHFKTWKRITSTNSSVRSFFPVWSNRCSLKHVKLARRNGWCYATFKHIAVPVDIFRYVFTVLTC